MIDFGSTDHGRFVGALLRASSSGLASATTERLLEGETPISGGPDAFSQWRSTILTHIGHLSAAIAAGCDTIFEEHVRWAKWGYLSRGLSLEELIASMNSLSETLLSELPEESGVLAAGVVQRAIDKIEEIPDEPPSHLSLDNEHGEPAAQYLMRLLEGDRDSALRVIEEAQEAGLPIADIYHFILEPALAEVGRLWLLGEVTIAEEHFATATTGLAIASLYPSLPRRAKTARTVVTVAVEGDQHEIGIRMVADHFTMDGWRVVHLGASIPAADLRQGIIDFGADLLAVSVSLANYIGHVEALITELRSDPTTQGVKVIVGGRGLNNTGDLWRRLGADGRAVTPQEAVLIGRRLVGIADESETSE